MKDNEKNRSMQKDLGICYDGGIGNRLYAGRGKGKIDWV